MNADQLTPAEMDVHLVHGTFRLSFIGMSNAGKSYRSRVLKSELGFCWYEVDAHIQSLLHIEDMEDISTWLGYPTQETYAERASQYLATEEICTHLKDLDTEGRNLVFDTTGSVIYLSEETKNWLRNQCLIVHIDVGEETIPEMSEQYFREPKPVLWGDAFNQQVGEDGKEALRRCYPNLLRSRLEEYRKMAHLNIPHTELFDKNAHDTLETIKNYVWKNSWRL
jgi:shikimate kinase